MNKNLFFAVLVLVFSLLIFACRETKEQGTTKADVAAEKDQVRVVYVINGALGDQAFYDSGQLGIDRIAEEYGVETRTIETNFDAGLYQQAMESIEIWNADVVFAIPYGFEDLVIEQAERNSDTRYISIEPPLDPSAKVLSIDFNEEEGAFLAGVAAALTTTETAIPNINADKKVGVVCGDDSAVVMQFVHGFKQGVAYIDSEIEVYEVYVGEWTDPVKGKQAAKQLYAQGVDVIFQVAALTGMGVLEAAAETGMYAIGVDTNQNGMQPGNIITSMVKDVGEVIYVLYSEIEAGTLDRTGLMEFGVEEGVLYLALDEYSNDILPKDIIDQIKSVIDKVNNSEIAVEKY